METSQIIQILNSDERTIENLADISHEIWSHWMKYLFSKCAKEVNGCCVIPSDLVTRWERQMNTNYSRLSDKEKNSDREQAYKIIAVLEKTLINVLPN